MSGAAEDRPLTLGTAGHIDHGKTALIARLTGIDTDRLPEEKARGISIDLGYAPLRLPGGRRISVVDVPGHERFVRTMVAGASRSARVASAGSSAVSIARTGMARRACSGSR